LKQISQVTEKGRHTVVIMDGASWHSDEIAKDRVNLSIMKLPPYFPEFNSIEQVWRWLRQHSLANQNDFLGFVYSSCVLVLDYA